MALSRVLVLPSCKQDLVQPVLGYCFPSHCLSRLSPAPSATGQELPTACASEGVFWVSSSALDASAPHPRECVWPLGPSTLLVWPACSAGAAPRGYRAERERVGSSQQGMSGFVRWGT